MFLPNAQRVVAVGEGGERELDRIDDAGLFAGPLNGMRRYRLRARFGDNDVELEDAYRFPPVLSDYDLYLLGEGTHLRIYDKLGAHPMTMEGVEGVAFVVWAPNARRVSVVGDFNFWDGRRHAMRVRGNGYWEIFVPGARVDDRYKYEIVARSGEMVPLKSDPVGFGAEMRPSTASVVVDVAKLPRPQAAPANVNALDAPMSIYEVHLGSWRKKGAHGEYWLTYRDLAEQLPAYAADMGFTHVELLPVTEHPFDGSWGYQPTGLFAPTSRFGSPADFVHLIDALHKAGIGVLLDWVPGHFPDDPHGLARFDGTALYEHADPRQGRHLDWGTMIYNYGRVEVTNFLHRQCAVLARALRRRRAARRCRRLHALPRLQPAGRRAGCRTNSAGAKTSTPSPSCAVPTRKCSSSTRARPPRRRNRPPGRWCRGRSTGAGSASATSGTWAGCTTPWTTFPRTRSTAAITTATSCSGCTTPSRKISFCRCRMTRSCTAKRSILGRMPGDDWQRFANLRAYYAFMFGHPGKKLMFMGQEFAQDSEWNHDVGLPWHLTQRTSAMPACSDWCATSTGSTATTPALHALDCEAAGFEWLVADDANHSTFAWLRKGRNPNERCVVVVNFTPQVLRDYRVRVPFAGAWREVLNSDAAIYGGGNVGNAGAVSAVVTRDSPELRLVVPPLAALFLVPEV